MREVIVRYESAWQSVLASPFEVGARHLQIGIFCDGSQESLLQLAKERVIYRPFADDDTYSPLTLAGRVRHITVGLLQTAGYALPGFAHIVFFVDQFFNQPVYFDKGTAEFITHMKEGGTRDNYHIVEPQRLNPFTADASQDPFYEGASWLPAAAKM